MRRLDDSRDLSQANPSFYDSSRGVTRTDFIRRLTVLENGSTATVNALLQFFGIALALELFTVLS